MNKETIIEDFRKTFSALENAINAFSDKSYNEIPFENSWTPAEVVQHIILSIENFASVLNGTTEETMRPVDMLIPKFESIFLNFETKMKSPAFIDPKRESYSREEQLIKVKQAADTILNAIKELDLSPTCLDFKLPSIGVMTRLEAVYFVIFHTQRHTHQLIEIKQFL